MRGTNHMTNLRPKLPSKRPFEGRIPTLPCILCKTQSSDACEYVALGGYAVCCDCANIVANIYSKKHSGEYCTWPNPKPENTGHQKAKISQSLRRRVFERDAYRCRTCGEHKDLTADHIHPESRGGETRLENLQTLCKPCNSRKGAKVAKPCP